MREKNDKIVARISSEMKRQIFETAEKRNSSFT